MKPLFRTRSEEAIGEAVVNRYSIRAVSILINISIVFLTVGVLIIPVFLLLWIPMSRAEVSITVVVSVLSFAVVMSMFNKSEIKEVLIGTAT